MAMVGAILIIGALDPDDDVDHLAAKPLCDLPEIEAIDAAIATAIDALVGWTLMDGRLYDELYESLIRGRHRDRRRRGCRSGLWPVRRHDLPVGLKI